jgi:hypothetical protein
MITHSHEQIEEHSSSLLHLCLHCATSLESASASNDEGQVVSTKLGVVVWRVSVGPASRSQDGADLDAAS